MDNVLNLNSKYKNCIYKDNHVTLKTQYPFACPCCGFVCPDYRKNIKESNGLFIIDFTWLEYDSSEKYTTFDGRNEGGKWHRHFGQALLDKNYCLIKKQ